MRSFNTQNDGGVLEPRRGAKRACGRYYGKIVVVHQHDRAQELQRLVDDRDFDELLRRVTLAEVAAAWHCYHRRQADGFDDPDWWALEYWMEAGGPESRRQEGLLALIASAATDDEARMVGAGPLENYLSAVTLDLPPQPPGVSFMEWADRASLRGDPERIAWAEAQRASGRFRTALSVVYVWGQIEDELAERLEAVAGVALPRPRR
jgi:hypothetical protein